MLFIVNIIKEQFYWSQISQIRQILLNILIQISLEYYHFFLPNLHWPMLHLDKREKKKHFQSWADFRNSFSAICICFSFILTKDSFSFHQVFLIFQSRLFCIATNIVCWTSNSQILNYLSFQQSIVLRDNGHLLLLYLCITLKYCNCWVSWVQLIFLIVIYI